MRRILTAFRRLPVDFGNESVCPVPVQRRRTLLRRGYGGQDGGQARLRVAQLEDKKVEQQQSDDQGGQSIKHPDGRGNRSLTVAALLKDKKIGQQQPDDQGGKSVKGAVWWRTRSLTVAALLGGKKAGQQQSDDQGGKLVKRAVVRRNRSIIRLRPATARQAVAAQLNGSQRGFTLVEILVVLVLLSLIVFALMAVFSGIQRAFRASLTQTDTLEGGRAVMDLITSDMATMTPANWQTNINVSLFSPVGFYVAQTNVTRRFQGLASPPSPLIQPLMSSPSGTMRTNILEDIFILSKGNINGVPSFIGTGYSVSTNLADGTLYPLYRFYETTNIGTGPAGETGLWVDFTTFNYTNNATWSHLMDGVVNLTARTYDTNGTWMTNGYPNLQQLQSFHVRFVRFSPGGSGEPDCYFYSNALPASVQIELGTLEDRTLQHAEGLAGVSQSNYLSNAIGQVHVFRQRVWIRNLDLTAYQ